MTGSGSPPSSSRDPAAELRSFGRRRGRVLSPRQVSLLADELPRLTFDITAPPLRDAAHLFDVAPSQVWLEIGFGGAEHLLWQADHHPHVGIIGCEPFQDGVVKAVTGVVEGGLNNVRLWPDDARPLVRWLPAGSITRAFVLYPDPWPKKRQQKRRLLNAMMLDGLARLLKPGGELRIATDIGDYARAVLVAARTVPSLHWSARQPCHWRERPADWPTTRYEAKAIAAGRRCTYLTFVRG